MREYPDFCMFDVDDVDARTFYFSRPWEGVIPLYCLYSFVK